MNPDAPRTPREERELRVTALLLGELPPAEAAALEQQIAADLDLTDLHARLRQAIGLLREATALPEPAGAALPAQLSSERRARLLAHFKSVPHPASAPPRDWSWVVPLSLAASLIALLGGTLFLQGFVQNKASRSAGDVVFGRAMVPAADAATTAQNSRWGLQGLGIPEAERMGRFGGVVNGAPGGVGGGGGPDGRKAAQVYAAPREAGAVSAGGVFLPKTEAEVASVRETVQLADSVNAPAPAGPEDQAQRVSGVNPVAGRLNFWSEDATRPTMDDAPAKLPAQPAVSALAFDAPSTPSPTLRLPRAPLAPSGGAVTIARRGEAAPPAEPAAAPASPENKPAAEENASGRASLATLQDERSKRLKDGPDAGQAGEREEEIPSLKSLGSALQATPGQQTASNAPQDRFSFNGGFTFNRDAQAAQTGKDAAEEPVALLRAVTSAKGAKSSATSEPLKPAQIYESIDELSLEAAKADGKAKIDHGRPLAAGVEVSGGRAGEVKRESALNRLEANAPLGETSDLPLAKQMKDAESENLDMLSAKLAPAPADEAPQRLLERGDRLGDLPELSASARPQAQEKAAQLAASPDAYFATGRENETRSRGLAEVDKKDFAKFEVPAVKLKLAEQPVAEDDALVRQAAAPAAVPQPEIATSANAFSTFSLNVSDVAFKLAAASLEQGKMPEPATVRSEEFLNAFDYRDPEPAAGAPLACVTERARYPFAQNRDLLRISVETAAAGRQPGRALNLVLLLDNSGSMERADRVRILHEALRVLAAQLQPQDRLSVVTFARTPRLWADGVAGDQAAEVTARVGEITPQGGTDISAALDLGYATARRHFQPDSINRVVLITDGAANLGDVNPDVLKQKVEANRQQGVALDCFGIGWEGYDDTLLETLSRNGDGRYGFINSPEEAATGFAGQLAGALRVAASDVKVQVEWNPRRVTAYRQIGYAKHQLKKEQFRDNSVDAAEIGAAESGNALYVCEVDPRGAGDLATVRVRFKVPGTADYQEHEWTVPFTKDAPPLEQASPALRLAGTASAFSEWLVASPYAGEVTPDRLLGLLQGVPAHYGADPRPQKLEWMIRTAKSVSGK